MTKDVLQNHLLWEINDIVDFAVNWRIRGHRWFVIELIGYWLGKKVVGRGESKGMSSITAYGAKTKRNEQRGWLTRFWAFSVILCDLIKYLGDGIPMPCKETCVHPQYPEIWSSFFGGGRIHDRKGRFSIFPRIFLDWSTKMNDVGHPISQKSISTSKNPRNRWLGKYFPRWKSLMWDFFTLKLMHWTLAPWSCVTRKKDDSSP